MIDESGEISSSPSTLFADQFNSSDAAASYAPLANEIWEELNGEVDTFLQPVGTAQCISGVTVILRKPSQKIEVITVEPDEWLV